MEPSPGETLGSVSPRDGTPLLPSAPSALLVADPALAPAQRRVIEMIRRVDTDLRLEDSGLLSTDAAIEEQFGHDVPLDRSSKKAAGSVVASSDRSNLPWAGFSSVNYLLMSVAFNSAQSVLTLLLPGWGVPNLALLYFTFGTASMFVSLLLGRIGPKWTVVLGMLSFFLWIGALLINAVTGSPVVVMVASFVAGLGSGCTWVAQGPYLHRTGATARVYNLWWLLWYTNWLIGGLIGGLVLSLLSRVAFLSVMLGLCGGALIMAIIAKNLPPLEGDVTQALNLAGALSSFRMMARPKMMLLLCTVGTRACGLLLYLTQMPVLAVNIDVVPFIMCAFGISILVLQVTLSLLWSKVPIWVWGMLHFATMTTGMALMLVAQSMPVADRLLTLYACGAIVGVAEGVGLALLNVLTPSIFPTDVAGAYSVIRGVEAYCMGVTILLGGFTPLALPAGIAIAFSIASGTCVTVLFVMLRKEDPATKTMSSIDSTTTATVRHVPNPVYRRH